MPRRAIAPSKKQTKTRTKASAKMSEPVAAEVPRRGRKPKSTISEPGAASLTDMLFPGGEEPPEIGSTRPVNARRRRKPKVQPDAQAPAAKGAGHGVDAESSPPEVTPTSNDEPSDVETDSTASPAASPRKTRRRRDAQGTGHSKASTDTVAASQPMQSSAARWDADTGTATFDWPSIEQVAATDGPNQAMAKLLLAARAEGANSRWPF